MAFAVLEFWGIELILHGKHPPSIYRVKPGERCTNVKLGQPLLDQGSESIKPPLDDNVHFRPNAGSAQTRSIGDFQFCGLAVVQSEKI